METGTVFSATYEDGGAAASAGEAPAAGRRWAEMLGRGSRLLGTLGRFALDLVYPPSCLCCQAAIGKSRRALPALLGGDDVYRQALLRQARHALRL